VSRLKLLLYWALMLGIPGLYAVIHGLSSQNRPDRGSQSRHGAHRRDVRANERTKPQLAPGARREPRAAPAAASTLPLMSGGGDSLRKRDNRAP
jgi:hypothetical protein